MIGIVVKKRIRNKQWIWSICILIHCYLIMANMNMNEAMEGVEGMDWKQCKHKQYLQDTVQSGMHLVCALPYSKNSIEISILIDGMGDIGSVYYPNDTGDVMDLFIFIHHNIHYVGSEKSPSKWKLFDFQGNIITRIEDLLIKGSGAIYIDSNFIWPGVRVGFVQYTKEGYMLTTLSLRPLVFQVKNFLELDECEYIRNVSSPHMTPSVTSRMDHDRDFEDTTWRTSTTYFLSSSQHPIIQEIDRRVASLTNTRMEQQESVQVLRYDVGQYYDFHTDYFDLRFYKKDEAVQQQTKNGEINRFATVLWYLSDVIEGGHTMFPMAFDSQVSDYKTDCLRDTGLKVFPRMGEVIIFYSLYPDGELDYTSIHGACDVIQGTKWAANKWIWSGDLSDEYRLP